MSKGREEFTLEDAHLVEQVVTRHTAETLTDEQVVGYLMFRAEYKGVPDPVLAELVARFRALKEGPA